MNFTGLKKKTAAQYYQKQLKKLKSTNDNIPKKIITIGVLADSRLFGGYDISRNLSQKLKMPHKSLEIIIFENLKDDFVTQHYNTFTEKDLGMFGKPKASNVLDFVNADYDLLINYCSHSSIYTNILSMRSKAKFKVSFANEELQNLYDFTIAVEGNKIDVFNDELAKYLQIFNLIE
ncbi:hypothetical protein FF125_15575 [Aureibaculum algae]|uniref:Uncharacterized protein n=1 Tax=Aureibaculum algae TaxID=2584122 RepID=A0A5B7TU83_9FLAO|nr:hypothetical protein [Aureibaculum algae]QCX39788.1 hypothetical protein FF125_15575 [Aureibaculum algae]